MIIYRIKTASTVDVVTLAEIKAHCRVDHTDDDVLLADLVKAAVSHFETRRGILGIAFGQQVWEAYLDVFPWPAIELDLPPIISIDSVEYIAPGASAYTVLAGTEWRGDTKGYRGSARPVTAWPATRDIENAVRVTFTAGFGNTSDSIPPSLKQAVKMLAAHWHENREPVNIGNITTQLPLAVDALISQWKDQWV